MVGKRQNAHTLLCRPRDHSLGSEPTVRGRAVAMEVHQR